MPAQHTPPALPRALALAHLEHLLPLRDFPADHRVLHARYEIKVERIRKVPLAAGVGEVWRSVGESESEWLGRSGEGCRRD